MKNFLATVCTAFLLCASAQAMTAIGTSYENAQTNCNIETGGNGTISNCSFNPNGTVICACNVVQQQEGSCTSAIGVGYQGAQSNCTIQSSGQGTISNCSFNPNGTVVCSCCQP